MTEQDNVQSGVKVYDVCCLAAPLQDDVNKLVHERWKEPFSSWYMQKTRKARRISEGARLLDSTLGALEASQIDFVALFGLITFPRLRNHVIFAGDPWQVSKVESSIDEGVQLNEGSVLHMFLSHLNGESNILFEYLSFINMGMTWSFLTKSHRFHNRRILSVLFSEILDHAEE
jgi:hypothetical protein